MKTSKYVLILGLSLMVAVAAAVGARLAEREGRAAFSRFKSWTGSPVAPQQSAAAVSTQSVSAAKQSGVSPAAREFDDPRPILPKEIPALAGQKVEIYFDALIIARDPDKYEVEIEAPTLMGSSRRRSWSANLSSADVGRHDLRVTIKALADGKTLAQGATTVVVSDPAMVRTRPLNFLIVGASNIHQGILPNDLWRRLGSWRPGQITFVGSPPAPTGGNFSFYRPTLPGVVHEGLGGWGWETFASHYMPGQESLYKLPKSPFVFLEGGKPTLDVGRYLDEKSVRGRLGAVIFDLGINETFGADPDDSQSLDASIDAALKAADKLVAGFTQDEPNAKIVIGIPAPFTRSAPVFEKRYGSSGSSFGDPVRHRRIVLALARRMIDHFGSSGAKVTLAPLYLSVDVIDGYWQIDPGHPNDFGADQMARVFEAALLKALSSD